MEKIFSVEKVSITAIQEALYEYIRQLGDTPKYCDVDVKSYLALKQETTRFCTFPSELVFSGDIQLLGMYLNAKATLPPNTLCLSDRK